MERNYCLKKTSSLIAETNGVTFSFMSSQWMKKIRLMKAAILGIIFIVVTFSVLTPLNAKVFEAFDQPSFKAAIDSVNKRPGGDTIRITANIYLAKQQGYIKNDVTVTAETNPDGTPKYCFTAESASFYVFSVDVKNYFFVENVKIDGYWVGVWADYSSANDNAEVKINNCHFVNIEQGSVHFLNGDGVSHPKITISNCTFNDTKGDGISIQDIIADNPEDISIFNCTFENHTGSGIEFYQKFSKTPTKCLIYDCVFKRNQYDGINFGSTYTNYVHGVIKNCVSSNNNSSGFSLGVNCQISNCIAIDNKTYGFEGKNIYATNCKAIKNGLPGFSTGGISLINGCISNGNGQWEDYTWGSGFEGSAMIFNSTAAYNKYEGFEIKGAIVNCTSAYNETGIRGTSNLNVYNSISYSNSLYDLNKYYSYTFEVYNTVSMTDGGYENIIKHNCTTEDPKLQGRDASGEVTENPDEVVCFALGEGSSALNLADRSLFTRESLMALIPSDTPYEDIMWFQSIFTEKLVESFLLADQMGNIRAFDGDKYDAGSIAGNTGTGQQNLISGYNPKKAANFGKSTITFFGKKFDNSINFTLKKQGENNIVSEKVKVEYSETAGMYKCLATFDFNNKKIGKWDIVVNTADTTVTIKDGLELETYIEPEIVLEIIGPSNIRNGVTNSFTIKYTNKGNVPVYCQPIIVELITPKRVTVEVKEKWHSIYTEGVYKEKFATIDGVLHKLDTLHDFRGNNTYTTFITPVILVIPPYGTGYLSFDVKISVDDIADDPIEIKAYTLLPLATGSEEKGIGFKSGGISETLWGCLKTVAKIVWDVVKVPLGAIPGVGCAIQVGEGLYSVATTEGSTGYKAANAAAEMGKTLAECATDIIPGGAAVKTSLKLIKGVSTASDIVGHATGLIECGSGLAKLFSRLVGSKDPNDKIGPISESGSTAFSDRTDFTYMINFENDEKATAPAQEVWITDELDLNVFDINTFEAGIMKFGDRIVTDIPFGAQNHTWRVDMTPEMDLITEIKLTLNKSKGIATWYFKSLDPITGELTTDPLAGFLPPNDKDGAGQGFVMFNIKLKSGLPDDVVVANKASIVFDNNPPIITPEWENKKDIVPPASTMLRPTYKGDNAVELKWQGTDNEGGSGVYCYDIFLKKDDGDYELFLSNTTETSAPFTIDKESKYSFYSIATDHAGNREKNKTKADISIPEVNLPFDDYAATKWNNTFMLNLKKLKDEGYEVIACKWFKNSKSVADGYTYSAGPKIEDQLETGALYYFQLTTNSHGEVYSTNKIIEKPKTKLRAYPNPAHQENTLTIEGTIQGFPLEIFNYMGVCVYRTTATGNITELMLNLPAGFYVVRSNNESAKVIIN